MKKFLALLVTGLMVMGFAMTASAGEYYTYADFYSGNTAFLGGYDVDSFGNEIYVNRNGATVDHYRVTTATTPTSDVNTHPSNIGPDGVAGTADDNTGTMATRTLSYVESYSIPQIGVASWSEIYATAAGLYFLDEQDAVSYYQFGGGVSKVTSSLGAASDVWGKGALLAQASDGTWWVGGENGNIYSYNGTGWDHEITHTVSSGGGHLDGLEIVWLDVTDDNVDNAEEWLFAADMTSDYMQRYSLDGIWQEEYTYLGGGGLAVEGMGFGANNHFWATGSGHLYEIGGGAFENVDDDDDNPPVPEPATFLLFGLGLLGLAGMNRKRNS